MISYIQWMYSKLHFWWNVKKLTKDTFHYNVETGQGIAFDHYDVCTDEVTVRYSRTGYVTGEGIWTRDKWLSHVKSIKR